MYKYLVKALVDPDGQDTRWRQRTRGAYIAYAYSRYNCTRWRDKKKKEEQGERDGWTEKNGPRGWPNKARERRETRGR